MKNETTVGRAYSQIKDDMITKSTIAILSKRVDKLEEMLEDALQAIVNMNKELKTIRMEANGKNKIKQDESNT